MRNYQSLNPTTGKLVKDFAEFSDTEAHKALGNAYSRYEKNWRFRSVIERASVVAYAATIIKSKVDELARYITLEMGKLIDQSRSEAELSASILKYYATHAEQLL